MRGALLETERSDLKPERDRTRERIAWSILGLLVVFHIVASVSHSLRDGRLAIVPLYDDVSYLADGLLRLQAFDTGGFVGLLKSLFQEHARAPITSVLSALGQALAGEPGPYVLSGLWVVAVLALAAYLLKGLPSMTRAGVLCAVLSLPILNTVIGVFRPDISWGLMTGATATILVTTDLLRASRRTLFFIGMLVGVSLLAKPNGAPAGLTVMATAVLAAMAIAFWGRRSVAVGPCLKALGLLVLGAAIVALPYFLTSGLRVLEIIWNVMVTKRELWEEQLSLAGHLKYLLQPYLAVSMLSWLWWVGAGLMIAYGCFCAVTRNSSPEALLRFVAVCVVVFVSYAIPALSPVKNAYIGCLYYGTLLMVFVWVTGRLLHQFPVPPLAVAAIGLAIFLTSWRPANIHTKLHPVMTAAEKAHRAVMPAVLQQLSDSDAPAPIPRVFVVSVGPIVHGTVNYLALKHHLQAEWVFAATWDEAIQGIASAHIVIISETGALGQSQGPFAVTGFQDRLLRMLESDGRFRTLTEYSDAQSHRTVAFARRFIPSQVRLTYPSGFRDQEGPYPTSGLPTFRWMTADTGTIILTSKVTAKAIAQFRCLAVVPTTLSVSVSVRREQTITAELPGGLVASNLRTLRLPVTLEAGKPVTLTVSGSAKDKLPKGWASSVLCSAPLTLLEREP
jgi:hypothetical protein